jgi:hypothetical protein
MLARAERIRFERNPDTDLGVDDASQRTPDPTAATSERMNTPALRPAALTMALILASMLAAGPRAFAQTTTAAGQNATTNSQLTTANTANALGTSSGTTTGTSQSGSHLTTGVICLQEMTATFCNVVGGPNTNGYGSAGGSGSSGGTGSGGGASGSAAASGGGGAANTSSIPACGGFPSPNELCN